LLTLTPDNETSFYSGNIKNKYMKSTILAVLFLIITIISVAEGRDRYSGNKTTIDLFERSFNFYYKSISDTIFFNNERGKEKFEEAITNVAFYDINSNTTTKLFPEDFNQRIETFYFEKSYVDSLRKIEFEIINRLYYYDVVYNNYEINKREISEYIYIVTYSKETKKYTLWSCHKTGKDLTKITEYDYSRSLKLDIYNRQIMIAVQVNNDIQISTFKMK